MKKLEVPYHKQNRDYTCGPVCLRMVLEYYGVHEDEVSLSMLCGTTIAGTSLAEIAHAAELLEFHADWKIRATQVEIRNALQQNRPVIVMVDANALYELETPTTLGHTIVVSAISKEGVDFHDPAEGRDQFIPLNRFAVSWQNMRKGMVIIWQKNET